jgi:hypothetical protein
LELVGLHLFLLLIGEVYGKATVQMLDKVLDEYMNKEEANENSRGN